MAVENAPVMDYRFASGRLTLSGHLAVPATGIAGAAGLVLLHGFPTRGRESEQSGKSFPELAERIASELGWVVLTVNFRGCGAAEGDFSLVGWLDDVHAAVGHLASLGVSGVWLAGFGTGGSLAVCEGARHRPVPGVAARATASRSVCARPDATRSPTGTCWSDTYRDHVAWSRWALRCTPARQPAFRARVQPEAA